MKIRPNVMMMTELREAAVKTRDVSRRLVDWIDERRALGTAEFTKQFAGDLAALVAAARKHGIDAETIAAGLREAANALGEEEKGAS